MSAALARNWWAIWLRGAAALLFGLAVLSFRRPALGALALLFAAYLAADGTMAIIAAWRAARRGERWPTLVMEGLANLGAAVAVLAWSAIAIVPLVPLASVWAIVTGALLVAAARRLPIAHGGQILAAAGIVSALWGGLASVLAPASGGDLADLAPWLVCYASLFGAIMLLLAGRLRRKRMPSIEPR